MESTSEFFFIDNFLNNTWKNQSDHEERVYTNSTGSVQHQINSVLLGLLLGTVSLCTVIMNILVLYAVKKERTLHTVGNLYIVSLSVADLIVGATVMPLNLVYLLEDEWNLGHIVCQFWLVMDYVASTASIFSLFILCLDRYHSVRQPLRYLKYRTRGRASMMISGAWLLSMTWIIPILGWRTFSEADPKPETENKCDTDFRFVTWFKVLTAVLNFYVPSLLMLWFYTQIYLAVRRHYRQRDNINKAIRFSDKNGKTNTTREHSALPAYSNAEGSFDQYSLEQPYYSKQTIEEQIHENWEKKKSNQCCYQAALFTVPKCKKTPAEPSEDCSPSCPEDDPDPETPLKLSSLPIGILQSENDNVPTMLVSLNDCNLPVPNSIAGMCEITNLSDVQKYATVICTSDFSHAVASPWSEGPDPKLDSTSVLTLKQSWQKFCTQSKQCVQSLRMRKERKAAKQLGFIIAAFMVCWIPYFVIFMVMAFCKTCIHHDLHMFTIWLGYFNSTLNPFIYPLCNDNFKRIFKRILHIHL
ncbi:histamine H1 receptor [Megalops cyprinoides]|uniref:histamine H1 receptor n=1 Tax=Megalops cyprinoides TaxID=118141 RepID=UPI001864D52E|nr:histamine H1 receptor [Megalops cyprinoides]